MRYKIIVISIFIVAVSCTEKNDIKTANGFLKDFNFNPNHLPQNKYVKTFENIDQMFGGDTLDSNVPELDVLTKEVIKDSISIGIGFFQNYPKPLFHTVIVRNVSKDRIQFIDWLEKMDLTLLSKFNCVQMDSIYFVQDNKSGLIYKGYKGKEKYGITIYVTHLPLDSNCPVKRRIVELKTTYKSDKTKLELNY